MSTNSYLEAREGNAGILGRLPPLPPGSGAPASLPLLPRPGARFPSRKKVWLDVWPAPATGRFPPVLSSVPRCPCLRRARPAASSASTRSLDLCPAGSPRDRCHELPPGARLLSLTAFRPGLTAQAPLVGGHLHVSPAQCLAVSPGWAVSRPDRHRGRHGDHPVARVGLPARRMEGRGEAGSRWAAHRPLPIRLGC